MKFKYPFNHKCLNCNADLYVLMREDVFKKIIKNEKFNCKNCSACLQWKDNKCYVSVKLSFILLIVTALLFPIYMLVFREITITLIGLLFVGAFGGVSFIFSMFCLEIERCNNDNNSPENQS